jgi:RNA polymerase sigma-70 factor (ECF subfamily)
MLGSTVDADDAAQETMIRAWKSIDRFDGRASVKTWLYRIATNVCLDELSGRTRRARPIEEGSSGWNGGTLIERPREYWLEPIPDVRAIPSDANPAERAILRQSIRLAFVAALQNLAPRQRATLLLVDVLGWSAAEVAETLSTSVAAVNSALQRARATLASRDGDAPAELSDAQTALLNRYVAAFERYDVDELVSLMREDATFSMPPYEPWLQGREDIHTWLLGMGAGCRGSRLLPTAACGSPAFAQYRVNPTGGHIAWGLVVLELSGGEIAGYNTFLDTGTLFPKFGLPMELPAR